MVQLQVDSLSFAYPDYGVFDGVSFQLASAPPRGHVAALMGASGCGKTTLLRLLAGLLTPTGGRILSVPAAPRISYLPQEPIIFAHLSRIDNARFYRRIRAQRAHFDESLLDEGVNVLAIGELLKSNRPIQNLSGGEKQRVALARALSIRPDVLLLDEPCAGLDAAVKQDFLIRLREIVDRHRLLVVYATHHADEALTLADSVLYVTRSETGDTVGEILSISARQFVENPPTVEATQMVNSGPINVIPGCKIDKGKLKLGNGDTIAVCDMNDQSSCTIVFAPDAIATPTNSRVGTSAVPLAVSERYGVCQLYGAVRILVPVISIAGSPVRLCIGGPAMVFADGRPGERVTLAEAQVVG